MFDDFLLRAGLAGIGVALVAGPLGCFIVWRRLAYFGDTMAHSALLGVALAVLLDVDLMLGVFGIALLVAVAIRHNFEEHDEQPGDVMHDPYAEDYLEPQPHVVFLRGVRG